MKTCMMFLSAVSLALVVACEKKEDAAPAKDEPVVAAKPGEPAATPAAAPTAAEPTAAAPAGDLIGVAQCDDYIAKYSKCVDSKAPADQKATLQKSIEDMRTAWKTAAATPEGKTGLATACQAALDSAKTSASGWGCEF